MDVIALRYVLYECKTARDAVSDCDIAFDEIAYIQPVCVY